MSKSPGPERPTDAPTDALRKPFNAERTAVWFAFKALYGNVRPIGDSEAIEECKRALDNVVRAAAQAGTPDDVLTKELEWRRHQMEHNWPRNQFGSLLTKGEWAAQAGPPADAVRAAATFLAAVDLLSDYALPKPAVLARQRLRAELAGTAPADPLRNAAQSILDYWDSFADHEAVDDFGPEMDGRLFALRAALAVGAPAAPAPETDIERADDWTDNEGADEAVPGRAPAPEPQKVSPEALIAATAEHTRQIESFGCSVRIIRPSVLLAAYKIDFPVSGGAPPAARPAAKSADDAPDWYDSEQAKYWAYGWMDCLRNLPAARPAEPPPQVDAVTMALRKAAEMREYAKQEILEENYEGVLLCFVQARCLEHFAESLQSAGLRAAPPPSEAPRG